MPKLSCDPDALHSVDSGGWRMAIRGQERP